MCRMCLPSYPSGLPGLKCCCWSSWPPVACCHIEAHGNRAGSLPALRSRSPPLVATRVKIKLKVTFLSLTLCSLLKTWSLGEQKEDRQAVERVSAACCLCGSQAVKQMAEMFISGLVAH